MRELLPRVSALRAGTTGTDVAPETERPTMTNLKNGQPIDIVLKDTDGEEWRSADYRGKMIVIHTCRGEF